MNSAKMGLNCVTKRLLRLPIFRLGRMTTQNMEKCPRKRSRLARKYLRKKLEGKRERERNEGKRLLTFSHHFSQVSLLFSPGSDWSRKVLCERKCVWVVVVPNCYLIIFFFREKSRGDVLTVRVSSSWFTFSSVEIIWYEYSTQDYILTIFKMIG